MKLCDKCGGDIPYPMAAMTYPSFRIAKNPGLSMLFQDIDLCPECSKKLDAWLKARPADPVRISGFDGLVCGNCHGAPVFPGDAVCPKCGAEIAWEDSDDDIDKMPVKCRDCAYWELAREPYVCTDCESRMERLSDLSKPMLTNDYIQRSDAVKAILGVSIYDTIEELEGARTIAENTWADGLYDAYKIIEEEVDAADVEPKRSTGWWIPGDYVAVEHGECVTYPGEGLTCSCCRYGFKARFLWSRDYCPHCGSRMLPEPPKGEDDAEGH